jgi:hypothetical protein
MWDTARSEQLQQLYQVHLWLFDSQLPAPGQGLSGVLSQPQLEQCRGNWVHCSWQLATNAQQQVSNVQQAVLAAVGQLPSALWQQPLEAEQVTADGLFSVDIAATTTSGVKVATEVDGPSHFVQPGNRLKDGTMFRNKALAVWGYVVISTPYWEWNQLGSAEQKQQCLLAKLQPALQQQQQQQPALPRQPAVSQQLQQGPFCTCTASTGRAQAQTCQQEASHLKVLTIMAC